MHQNHRGFGNTPSGDFLAGPMKIDEQELPTVRTFGEAYQFVMFCKICTVFGGEHTQYPSLWNHTDLSLQRPAPGTWCPRALAVWKWQRRLPQAYPDSVFFGKIPGGDAALMEMTYFKNDYYPKAFQPIAELPPLAGEIYELICKTPSTTVRLRNQAVLKLDCTADEFDAILTALQVSLNITRSNDPKVKADLWLPMSAVHSDITSLA